MCCKCPPFTPTATYLLLSILITSYYSYKAAEVDNDFGLISIKSCPALTSESFLINLALKRVNEGTQAITGNVSMPFDIDRDVKVTLEGYTADKITLLIKNRPLCKIIKNYMMEEGICPIRSGFHKIGPLLVGIDLPYEMWGSKKFRMKILKDDGVVACKIFQVKNLNVDYVRGF